jgi:hypothetical protein
MAKLSAPTGFDGLLQKWILADSSESSHPSKEFSPEFWRTAPVRFGTNPDELLIADS